MRYWIAVMVCFCQVVEGQDNRLRRDLSAGKFLVANRKLLDANFTETVILLLRYDLKGTMGLIVNRPTRVKVSEVLQGVKRPDVVYLGGPVGRTGIQVLLRVKGEAPAETQRVFENVYLTASKGLLEKTMAGGAGTDTVRAYLGYSGWTVGQLEHELLLGSWHIMSGEVGTVFDADAETVWPRLIRRTELQMAFGPVIEWPFEWRRR